MTTTPQRPNYAFWITRTDTVTHSELLTRDEAIDILTNLNRDELRPEILAELSNDDLAVQLIVNADDIDNEQDNLLSNIVTNNGENLGDIVDSDWTVEDYK